MSLSIGVDLAQARDRSVVAAVSSYLVDAEPLEGARRRARKVRHHTLVRLEKLKVGLAYPAQVDAILTIAEGLAGAERPTLWVDATGVGKAVVGLIRAASPYPVKAVTLTSATGVGRHGQDLSVPKADLVGKLEIALSSRRLHAVPDLALAGDLDTELRAFSYDHTPSGRLQYEGRGEHDDMVIALCLAVYAGEQGSLDAFRDYMAGRATDQERTETEYVR